MATQTFDIGDLDKRTADDIYEQAADIADDGNASLRRSLYMIAQSKEIGAHTLNNLKQQGQQIERISDNVEHINTEIKYSNRKVRGIGSLWGSIWNTITGGSAEATRQRNHLRGIKHHDNKLKRSHSDGETPHHISIMLTHAPSQRTTASEHDFYDTVDENDAILNDISANLQDLKILAIEMGNELDAQHKRLDIVTDQVNIANIGIRKTTRRVNALL